MKRKKLWVTLSLVNLCIVGLLGMTLRTKFLFPLGFVDYKNILSAHSHFAFGGWVTLALMTLLIDNILSPEQKQKNIYQVLLWGIEFTAIGMVMTFPFQGYAPLSIIFSTLFIFFTYGFSYVFIKDVTKIKKVKPVLLLSVCALTSLVVSSVGPFTLAYILATKTGDAILYRDSIYVYLHFQYNGFFTLSVFALFFNYLLKHADYDVRKRTWPFVLFLSLSILPSLFLSLLWHSSNLYIRVIAIAGCGLTLIALFYFIRLVLKLRRSFLYPVRLARTLLVFALVSFAIKMILQTGTIIPSLGNAVFGFRPIIIGFLHLVFLGFVTFYLLANLTGEGVFPTQKKMTTIAIIYFSIAIILNETILMIDGVGLMLGTTHQIYPWLLWVASILLFTGALFILVAWIKNFNNDTPSYSMT